MVNDDFEKQARHQNSSLEDMEQKYNKAIERGVLLDEEIKNGEQEREQLRIETQRLRDELSDLKVEAEITQEKLRLAEENWANARNPSGLIVADVSALRSQSPTTASEAGSTSATTISSPTVATPPPKSETSTVQTSPPSPPLSETGAAVAAVPAKTKTRPPITPANKRILEPGTTPRPLHSSMRPPRHSRGPSIPTTSAVRQPGPTSAAPKRTTARPSIGGGRQSLSGLPQPTSAASRSESLYQIRGMRKKLSALEERVQSARSKLPAPTTTPPRASPRQDRDGHIPASVTVRSSRKRPSTSTTATGPADGPASRLSFGFNPSASVGAGDSRPSSRASMTSGVPRPSSRASGIAIARPPSQSSMRTPSSLGYYPQSERRPRSSISGSYAAMHGREPTTPSLSRSEYGSRAGTPAGSRHAYSQSQSQSQGDTSLLEEDGDGEDGGITPTARRTTIGDKGSAIPGPARRQSSGLVRRQSGIGLGDSGGGGEMLPPQSTAKRERKTGVDIGETF